MPHNRDSKYSEQFSKIGLKILKIEIRNEMVTDGQMDGHSTQIFERRVYHTIIPDIFFRFFWKKNIIYFAFQSAYNYIFFQKKK